MNQNQQPPGQERSNPADGKPGQSQGNSPVSSASQAGDPRQQPGNQAPGEKMPSQGLPGQPGKPPAEEMPGRGDKPQPTQPDNPGLPPEPGEADGNTPVPQAR